MMIVIIVAIIKFSDFSIVDLSQEMQNLTQSLNMHDIVDVSEICEENHKQKN